MSSTVSKAVFSHLLFPFYLPFLSKVIEGDTGNAKGGHRHRESQQDTGPTKHKRENKNYFWVAVMSPKELKGGCLLCMNVK